MPYTQSSTSDSSLTPSRYQETKRVTIVGAIVNLFLAVAQLLGGFLTQSQALIADGLHTLSDLASDFVVIIAAKLASKDADDDHPYGHGRIETVATIILGLSLSIVGVSIAFDAFERLIHPDLLLHPTPLGLFFAFLGIISKESLFHYTKRVAKQINSPMLLANAWHHRSDAISSLVVLIGIAGAVFLDIQWLDAVAAIIVSMMILIMGLQMIKSSLMELVDTALEPEQVREIQRLIAKIDGVQNVHMLRTRKMGGTTLADVHVQVNSKISVSEGHHIAERVVKQLASEYSDMKDITVHIDPEDDECSSPCGHLPSREELLKRICPQLQNLGVTHCDATTLHFLDGKISISLFLRENLSFEEIIKIKNQCLADVDIHHCSVYIEHL